MFTVACEMLSSEDEVKETKFASSSNDRVVDAIIVIAVIDVGIDADEDGSGRSGSCS